jgi:hypothetical protein
MFFLDGDPSTPETDPPGGGGEPADLSVPKADPPATPDRTFTQAEVNTLVGNARTEATERTKSSLAPEIEKAGKWDSAEREGKTELQRFQEDLAQTQQQLADSLTTVATTMIESEIKVKASLAKVIDPDAAVQLIGRTGIAYTPEGGVTGVDEAVAILVEEKPYLISGTPPKPKAPNINPEEGPPGGSIVLSQEQIDMAGKLGITTDSYMRGIETGKSPQPR